MQSARIQNSKVDLPTALKGSLPVPKPDRLATFLPALNVGVSWASNILLVLGSFVVTPAILHALGVDWYDRWLLVMSFVGHMRILDLGMTSGCMKFSAASLEKGDRATLISVFNTSLAIFSGSGLIALLVTVLMTYLLPILYPATLSGLEPVILALGASVAFDLFSRPYAASLRGRSYFFVYDSVEIMTYLVFKLGLVLYLSQRGLSLWTLSLLTLTESLVRNGVVCGCALWFCDWTRVPNPFRAERAMLMTLMSYSGALFIMALADLMRFQIDAAVIGYFLSDSSGLITTYGIGFRLVLLSSTTIGVVWSVLIPRFSGLSEKGDTESLWALYRKASLNTGLLTVFGLVNIAVFGLAFLKLWLNVPWVIESYYIMLIALPAYFVGLISGPAGGLLAGVGKLRWQTAITVAEALSNVVLSVLLVQRWGIYGVCLGTAIPMILFRGIAFPYVLQKELNLPVSSYYRLHAPTFGLAFIYICLIGGFAFVELRTFFEFTLACVASSIIFGVLLWFWMPQMRAMMRRLKDRLLQVVLRYSKSTPSE